MIKFILVFMFFISSFNAQNKRFIYEYRFIPDSTNRSDIKAELMYLDVSKKGSIYYSWSSFVNDSTMTADAKLGKMTMPNEEKINERITKDYPGYKTFLYTKFYIEKYKVLDERKQNWKILEERDTIENFSVQKASLNFAGRLWTGWFTTEIPIQDGPYKFHGLPGLILKIEDETKSHSFVLKGIKTVSQDFVYSELNPSKKNIELTQEQYSKLYGEYRQDPVKDLRQLYNEGKIPAQNDQSGNVITPLQMIKNIESGRREIIQKDNNIIELDLLKTSIKT